MAQMYVADPDDLEEFFRQQDEKKLLQQQVQRMQQVQRRKVALVLAAVVALLLSAVIGAAGAWMVLGSSTTTNGALNSTMGTTTTRNSTCLALLGGEEGSWQPAVGFPIQRSCVGAPPGPVNGAFACQGTFAPGSTCVATCAPGFRGTLSATCAADGLWGAVTGSCEPVAGSGNPTHAQEAHAATAATSTPTTSLAPAGGCVQQQAQLEQKLEEMRAATRATAAQADMHKLFAAIDREAEAYIQQLQQRKAALVAAWQGLEQLQGTVTGLRGAHTTAQE